MVSLKVLLLIEHDRTFERPTQGIQHVCLVFLNDMFERRPFWMVGCGAFCQSEEQYEMESQTGEVVPFNLGRLPDWKGGGDLS